MTNPTNPAAPGTVHKPAPAPTPAQAKPTVVGATDTTNGGDAAEGEKKKEKKAKTGVARPRLTRPDENHIITVLRPGAKTGKSGERFDQVRTGMTVKEYVELMTKEPFNRTVGQAYHTLRWDTDPNRNLMHIGPTIVDVPPPEPKVEKKPKVKAEKAETAKPASAA